MPPRLLSQGTRSVFKSYKTAWHQSGYARVAWTLRTRTTFFRPRSSQRPTEKSQLVRLSSCPTQMRCAPLDLMTLQVSPPFFLLNQTRHGYVDPVVVTENDFIFVDGNDRALRNCTERPMSPPVFPSLEVTLAIQEIQPVQTPTFRVKVGFVLCHSWVKKALFFLLS